MMKILEIILKKNVFISNNIENDFYILLIILLIILFYYFIIYVWQYWK